MQEKFLIRAKPARIKRYNPNKRIVSRFKTSNVSHVD